LWLFANTHLVEYFLEHWTDKATPWIRSRVLRDPRTIFTKQLIILPSSEATVAKLKLKISASLSLLRANNKTVRYEREHMIRKTGYYT
jgi:hypothetical protein